MILDLNDSAPGSVLEYDLCIVGSGPAGMTVAAELADSGLRVCVLESGRLRTTRLGDQLRKVVSEGMTIKDYSRERVLGGASTTWAGLSSPLDAVDTEVRDYLRHSGWPIAREELGPYYARAAERYRFAPPALYAADGFGALKAQGDVQLTWQDVQEKIFLAASEPQDFGKEWRRIFDGPSVDLCLDATLLRLERGQAPGSGTLAAVAPARPRVHAGLLRTRDGREHSVQAWAFVLATGGIENARILLNSTDVCPAGLGNEHDQVGRYMMNHPKNYCGLIQLEQPVRELPYHFGCLHRGYAGYAGLRLSEDVQRRRGLLNSYVRFEPIFPWSDNRGVESLVLLVKRSKLFFSSWKQRREGKLVSLRDYSETGDDSDLQNERKSVWRWLGVLGSVVIHAPSVLQYLYYRLRESAAPDIHTVRLRNFMEMEPDPENRVVLGQQTDPYGQRVPVVAHQTTELDRRSLLALHEVLGDELERNGFGRLQSELAAADPWPIDLDASHHMGTTRMGTAPDTSVVDPCLRVHSLDNVYMAGASVFPTSGCANPTMTLVALSIRLAEHLRQRFPAAAPARTIPTRFGSGSGGGGRPVFVVGAGQRVQQDVLPVLARLGGACELAGVYAKHARTLAGPHGDLSVRTLDALAADGLPPDALIYVAVSKGSVPGVLRKLLDLGADGADLLVDTPVLLFKHLGQMGLAERFANAWVPEDCTTLPWFDVVRQAQAELGAPTEAVFDRSAYRYHGLAMFKLLLGSTHIRWARRRKTADGGARVEVRLGNGARGTMIEPRDYAHGRFSLLAPGGAIVDAPDAPGVPSGARRLQLDLCVDGGRCTGFQLGDWSSGLDDAECELVGPVQPGDTVTARMDDLKRVGLYRLLRDVHAGRGAYPLWEGLEDMTVDYLLDKLGRYRSTALTSLKSGVGRSFLGAVTRVAGRG